MSPYFNYPHNASLSFTFILKGDFILGIDILQEDTRIVAIAQTILEVPEKERMRLTFRDPIHIELIDSSLEIFIDKKCCHISSDLQF